MKYTRSAALMAFVAAGCIVAGADAVAQSMEVVTVEAMREVIVGKSAIGAPIKELSIRSRVSYADLDLTTTAGSNELEKRITGAATSSCNEIKAGFDLPVDGWTVNKCIDAAVAGGMGQAKAAIAAAQAKKK